MGPGHQADLEDLQNAYTIGQLIAEAGWILLTGGRNEGVMDAASKGAKQANGITVGILPGDSLHAVSAAVDIPIITGMGSARNNINVLSSDLIIACGIGAGTISEIALALKANKKVILLNKNKISESFFTALSPQNIFIAKSPEDAIKVAKDLLLR